MFNGPETIDWLTMVLTVGPLKDTVNITEETLQRLELALKGKELLGQMLGPHETFTGKLNPLKVSHIVKHFKYFPMSQGLVASIECLPTNYGKHLQMILQKGQERIDFVPAFVYDDIDVDNLLNFKLITVNAVVKGIVK